ncbi:MAG: FIST C-terminal domain-containing protein [Synergistaceae bacterium]|jgi:hypothetical protein|nr:FIST C-terminal domain-containing protein [Synergistaceae bacterium]
MIKVLTACTEELDDLTSSVELLLERLDLEHSLLKNSVGLLACCADSVTTGLVSALAARLPFDLVGVNTLGSATPGGGGQLVLSLAVLTSDDVSFSAGLSDSLEGGYEKGLRDLYDRVAGPLPEKAALMLSFVPVLKGKVPLDLLVKHLDAISGNIPIFGMLPSDFTAFFRKPLVIYNDQVREDSFAMVLVSGNIKPRFRVSSIPENKIMKRKAIVTASEANILKEVNGIAVIEYMKSLGLVREGKISGTQTIPLIVDCNDGTPPAVYAIYGQTPEGYAVLGGTAPVNSTIGIGTIDADDVLESAERLVETTLNERRDFLLVGSCVVRNFALKWKNRAELDLFRSGLGENPFLFAYTGGEICPVRDSDGRLVNRFHNLALTTCAF